MERRIIAYKLNFSSPLHLDAHGVGYEKTEEFIHSDTLFSALMTLWGHFYNDDIASICQDPPFCISSAFPYKSSTYFFPRPMVKIGKGGEDDTKVGKKFKKVKYISKDLFEALLKREPLEFHEKETFQKYKFWFGKDAEEINKNSRIFMAREVPRVTIDRATSSSEIFYFSEIIFEKDSGLFFLAEFKDKEFRSKFETILRLLGDEGIGGDKRVGKGMFSLQIDEEFSLSIPQNADSFLTLSLYYPREDEFNSGLLKGASYELVSRKGWLHVGGAMSLKRREIKMFSEGSVFSSLDRPDYGANPCVLEKDETIGLAHNIYRYGMSFYLPIILEHTK
jgi:CRISPR-associated protein Csm4